MRMGSSPTTPISYVSIHAVDDPCGTQFDCRRRRPLVIADDNDDNRILDYLSPYLLFSYPTYIGQLGGVYVEIKERKELRHALEISIPRASYSSGSAAGRASTSHQRQ